MTKSIDVTHKIEFNSSDIDGEHLPISKCLCGKKFGYWDYTISIYDDLAYSCPNCGIKLYFKNEIKVYMVIDE